MKSNFRFNTINISKVRAISEYAISLFLYYKTLLEKIRDRLRDIFY